MSQNITRGIKFLIAEANKITETISIEKAQDLYKNEGYIFVDLRDIRELKREGKIPGAFSCPRGMLEFWLDPESPYFKNGKLDMNKEMVLFCAGGLRSALAAKALKEMGFEKVSHIDGGFAAINQSDFKIV